MAGEASPHDPWVPHLMRLMADVSIELQEWIHDGDAMSLRWTLRGTAVRTGHQVVWPGAGFVRYDEGRIVEAATYADPLALCVQLDVLPEMALDRALVDGVPLADPFPWGPARPNDTATPRILVVPGPRLSGGHEGRVLEALDRVAPPGRLVPAETWAREPALPEIRERLLLALPDPEGLLEKALLAMVLVDPEDRIMDANDTFTCWMGTGLGSLIGRVFRTFLHPEDRVADEEGFLAVLAGVRPEHGMEAALVGESVSFRGYLSTVRLRPRLMLRTFQDIRGRRLEDVVRFQEAERRLLAWDLTSGLGRNLQALQADLEARGTPPGTADRIQQMMQHLERTMRELLSPVPDGKGLAEALRLLARQVALEVRWELGPGVAEIAGAPALFAWRIVQEALCNAARHGEAQRAEVRLVPEEGRLRGEVRDDGRGFEPGSAAEGLGLAGMRERCSLLGGSLDLRSSPGRGATLEFEIPMGTG